MDKGYFDGLVLERRISSALAMEFRLSCTRPSIYGADDNNIISKPISLGLYSCKGIIQLHVHNMIDGFHLQRQ